MELIRPEEPAAQLLPGRIKRNFIGEGDSPVHSDALHINICRYCAEAGPMLPHRHAEEALYVIYSDGGFVRFGPSPEELGEPIALCAGQMMHFPEGEWHVFGYPEGGSLELLCIFGKDM